MSTALLNLLFAQAIYKLACDNDAEDVVKGVAPGSKSLVGTAPTKDQFIRLAQELKSHPLNRDFNLSPDTCRNLYSALLPSNPSRPTENMLRPLMVKLYESYKRDIVNQIKNDETEYRNKLKEVEQIEKGKWDAELMKELKDIETEKSQLMQQKQLRIQRELQQRQEQEKQKQLQKQRLLSQSAEPDTKSTDEKKEGGERVEIKAEAKTDTPAESEEEEDDDEEEEQDGEEEQEEDEEEGGEEETVEEPVKEEEEEKPRVRNLRSHDKEEPESKDEEQSSPDEPEEEEEEEEEPTGSRKRKRHQTSPSPTVSTGGTNKRFQSVVGPLLANISSNKSASFFAHPVNANDAPNYAELIYSPTDLRTIKAAIKDGSIASTVQLERELEKMFANAVMYNAWDSDMSRWAREMQLETESTIAMFRAVERTGGRSASGTPGASGGTSTPAKEDASDTKRRKK